VEWSLFIRSDGTHVCIILIYVDDILILSSTPTWEMDALSLLQAYLTLTITSNINRYLNVNIDPSPSGIFISSASLARDTLNRWGTIDTGRLKLEVPMTEDPNVPYPQIPSCDPITNPLTVGDYQSKVGSIMFFASTTRPDLSYSVGRLSQGNLKPTVSHLQQLKRTQGYISTHPSTGILYPSTPVGRSASITLAGYTDASYIPCISGWVFTINGGAVSWSSRKQKGTALSSTEAEIVAMTSGTQEAIYLRMLLSELGFPQSTPTVINVDSSSALALVGKQGPYTTTRHMANKLNWLYEAVQEKQVQFKWIPSSSQAADFLTKPLPTAQFNTCLQLLQISHSSPSPEATRAGECCDLATVGAASLPTEAESRAASGPENKALNTTQLITGTRPQTPRGTQ
jgi:hypothetical protein